jgi:ubiquinone/menaquinone biosynthesis C-methylase UbiE
MPTNIQSSRRVQIVAWAVASLFVLGFFFNPVGVWTGPIMGVWFVGTQKLRRGFLWMIAFGVIPSLIFGWRKIPLTGPEQALHYLGWTLLAAVLGVLPFTFHRLVSPRLPGFLSTLPLSLAAVAIPSLALALHIGAASMIRPSTFLIFWFAATIVWLWNQESRATKFVFAAGFIVVGGFRLFRPFSDVALPINLVRVGELLIGATFSWICLGAALFLSVWALFRPIKQRSWASRPETIARLQSPFTGEPLHVVSEQGREALVSSTGERFPVRNGIPAFLKPEDLTGDNGKYNHLYQVIGGFYDDTQRIFIALKGFNRDVYFRSYMSLLEAKPGDSVLETSVGTGLNFKYLPRGVQLSGLDLSPEMLANCQNNLRRWQMDADLYLGNAESLPFADSSFDVVFHVGGINFFNDRAKAIREMIRVAKPGSLLLIADETEKHVKQIYEKGPGGHLYKNRKEPVSAPIDLVPPEMQEIHLEIGRTGEWYMLTFRKPAAGLGRNKNANSTKQEGSSR